MSDQKIASSGAAIFWEVAMDGNLANVDGVEGADTMSATGIPSPAIDILDNSYLSASLQGKLVKHAIACDGRSLRTLETHSRCRLP